MFTKILYINLDRRTDRDKHMQEQLKKINFNGEIERISAVDGKLINLDNIKNLLSERTMKEASIVNPKNFAPGSFMTKGAVGCALSHRNAFINILNNNHDKVLIIEDDITFDEDFNKKLEEYLLNIPEYDILYLGYHFSTGSKNINEYCKKPNNIIFGTYGYIINKKSAKILLDMFPIDRQIDSEMSKVYHKMNVFHLNENKRLILPEDTLINSTDIQYKQIENFNNIKNKNTNYDYQIIILLIIILIIII